jgi:ribosome modulation factor
MRIVDIKEKDKAEQAGFAAGKSGKPISSCPYEGFNGKQTVETMCHRIWMCGWFRGNFEFKRNK